MKPIMLLLASLLICQVASEYAYIKIIQQVGRGFVYERDDPRPETGCVMEGKLYQEGENITKECEYPMVCRNKTWEPAVEGCLKNCTIYAEGDVIENSCNKPQVCKDNDWEYLEGCLVDCIFYAEGEEAFVNDCGFHMACKNETIAYSDEDDKPWNHYVPDVGLVFFSDVRKNFYPAIDCCNSIGWQLAVVSAFGFQSLVSYIKTENVTLEYYWMGVKDGMWLDGRNVTEEEWAPGQPDEDPPSCSFIIATGENIKLFDQIKCNSSYALYFICENEKNY